MKTLIKTRLYLYVLLMGMFFVSCSDSLEDVAPDASNMGIPLAEGASVTNNTDPIWFAAVAHIEGCHGENIKFSGWLEQRVVTRVDGQGKTHIMRQFRPTDLSAEGWTGMTPAIGSSTGTTYDIIGGAEMFSIHYGEGGDATLGGSRIFIHQGTLVFVNQEDGSRVVARHVIRKTPGQGIQENQWLCVGK